MGIICEEVYAPRHSSFSLIPVLYGALLWSIFACWLINRRLSLIHLCLARSYECCLPPHISMLSSFFPLRILDRRLHWLIHIKRTVFFILPCRLFSLLLASASRRQFLSCQPTHSLFRAEYRVGSWRVWASLLQEWRQEAVVLEVMKGGLEGPEVLCNAMRQADTHAGWNRQWLDPWAWQWTVHGWRVWGWRRREADVWPFAIVRIFLYKSWMQPILFVKR